MPEWALKLATGGDGLSADDAALNGDSTSEDCLFLDVVVTEEVLSAAGSDNPGEYRTS